MNCREFLAVVPPHALERAEYTDIKWLEFVGCMRGEAKQVNSAFASEVNHQNRSVRTMTIEENHNWIIGVRVCLHLGYDRHPEVFEAEVIICPPIWRGCDPIIVSFSTSIEYEVREPYVMFPSGDPRAHDG